MNPPRSLILILTLCLGSLVLRAADATAAPAAEVDTRSLDQVKVSMQANLKAVDQLKKDGKAGETNKAYLEARAELTDKEKALVKTENKDRKAIYKALAERTGVTLETVQQVRAKQIRERSAVGLWLQDPDGHWYRKVDEPTER
ncbi:MAG: YdbL family protein [Verrucomicrobiae bacterium]|nr:YdbL family protein [Verrucomicrobiae bacterium]MCP5520710.1 YdbL family protein [Verrucomicrobiales bacterium]